MLENQLKPNDKIQEFTEKRKKEELENKEQDMAQTEEAREKNEQKKEKVKDVIKTGASVVSSIPHVATFSIGLGAGSLIPTLLKEMWEKQKDKK